MSGCDRDRRQELAPEDQGDHHRRGSSPCHHGNPTSPSHVTQADDLLEEAGSLLSPLDPLLDGGRDAACGSHGNSGGFHGNRSVPRDDSGLSIVSGGVGRPSDSGYGTDSPASLNTSALHFPFPEAEDLENEFELYDDNNDGDDVDDVFADDFVVNPGPGEELGSDEDDLAPATNDLPTCDSVDGLRRRSRVRPDTGQSESSISAAIEIPRPLRTERVALAYTPPQTGSSETGRLAVFSPAGAMLFSARNVHDRSAVWSVAQAQLQNPTATTTGQSTPFLTSVHRRRSLPCVRVEGGPLLAPPAAARPFGRGRCHSEPGVELEQHFGQELRRISDEFQLTYQRRGDQRHGRDVADVTTGTSPGRHLQRRGSWWQTLVQLLAPPVHETSEGSDEQTGSDLGATGGYGDNT